jgi:hypothetical protein
MVYHPNPEREEYSPPDKKRVMLVIFLGVVGVLAVALMVYGLFVLARGMAVAPLGML